ncbi:putative lipid-transfer protein DIR1 [Morus notabilis]|uniref:putative lipid-transfer protein DIR1 n=1 Tax=Morus notabilis TaxID=981085 RepID=UPI000CED0B0B|nr:putative lipid-transfer protein DIR1 [Morus notabilis]
MEMIKLGSRKLAVVMVLVAMFGFLFEGSRGQDLCKLTDQDLNTCRPAVTAPNPADPTGACCEALKKADLVCLCQFKNSAFLPILGIDPDLAMALPKKCVTTEYFLLVCAAIGFNDTCVTSMV